MYIYIYINKCIYIYIYTYRIFYIIHAHTQRCICIYTHLCIYRKIIVYFQRVNRARTGAASPPLLKARRRP